MNFTRTLSAGLALLICGGAGLGQSAPDTAAATVHDAAQTTPVSYASVTQLNAMLTQLENASKSTQEDMLNLRIDRWKTDKNTKEQALNNVDSIQRNLQGALPEIIAQLRAAPEDVSKSFKLYRNLDALYDVLGNVLELTGAFGSKDNLQALENDLNSFEATRKQMAERIETLSAAKESEIVRLRTDLKAAQAAVPTAPPKKVIVDDTEPPPKKPAVKKKTTKKSTKPATTKPPAIQTERPPDQQSPQ
jgi:Skp family chaperone for outer membrane proteins